MNRKTRIIVISSIIVLVLGMAFFPKLKQWFHSEEKNSSVAVNTRRDLVVDGTILKPQTLHNVFRTKGILFPDEEVDLTFETSGKITGIYFKEGAYVSRGTLLAKVNDQPLQAELKKLQAQLPLAEDRVYRQKTLLEKDAVSQETYQTVTTELETLKADIELMKSRIAQTELRAPFGGVIGLRLVSEGAYASPSVVVARLTKISPLKVEFSVNENQVNDIKPGTFLSFTVENDLETYHASVYAVESQLDENTLSMKARARYANPSGKIKPGQSASVEIQLNQVDSTIVIPSISSIKEMGNDVAYIYHNGKAKRVTLTIGIRTESSVEVMEGLSEGDTLLITGVMQLRDGLPVKINRIVPNTAD